MQESEAQTSIVILKFFVGILLIGSAAYIMLKSPSLSLFQSQKGDLHLIMSNPGGFCLFLGTCFAFFCGIYLMSQLAKHLLAKVLEFFRHN